MPPGAGGYGPPTGANPQGYGPPGGTPGIYSPPGTDARDAMTQPMRYADVVWYRKSGIQSFFVLGGAFCLPPLLWTTCFIVLTGPVYMDDYDERGQLKTWGPANKVVAVVLLVLQCVAIVVRFAR